MYFLIFFSTITSIFIYVNNSISDENYENVRSLLYTNNMPTLHKDNNPYSVDLINEIKKNDSNMYVPPYNLDYVEHPKRKYSNKNVINICIDAYDEICDYEPIYNLTDNHFMQLKIPLKGVLTMYGRVTKIIRPDHSTIHVTDTDNDGIGELEIDISTGPGYGIAVGTNIFIESKEDYGSYKFDNIDFRGSNNLLANNLKVSYVSIPSASPYPEYKTILTWDIPREFASFGNIELFNTNIDLEWFVYVSALTVVRGKERFIHRSIGSSDVSWNIDKDLYDLPPLKLFTSSDVVW